MKKLILAGLLATMASTSFAFDRPADATSDHEIEQAYNDQYHVAWDWALSKLKVASQTDSSKAIHINTKGSRDEKFTILNNYANNFAYRVVHEGEDWNSEWNAVHKQFSAHSKLFEFNKEHKWHKKALKSLHILEDFHANDPWKTAKDSR